MFNLLGNKSRVSHHGANVCSLVKYILYLEEKETFELVATVKPVLSGHSKIKANNWYSRRIATLMQVKSIAECSPWSILQSF